MIALICWGFAIYSLVQLCITIHEGYEQDKAYKAKWESIRELHKHVDEIDKRRANGENVSSLAYMAMRPYVFMPFHLCNSYKKTEPITNPNRLLPEKTS